MDKFPGKLWRFEETIIFNLKLILNFSPGFLGLLMGGSLLSLIEIFYHFVLKRFFEKAPRKMENGITTELEHLKGERE